MKSKKYFLFSAIVFFLAGLLHLIRVVMGHDLVLGEWDVPVYVSVIAVIITWFLVYSAWNLRK